MQVSISSTDLFNNWRKKCGFIIKIIVQHSENPPSFLSNGKIVQLYRAMNRTLSVHFLACEKNIHDSYMELNNVSVPMFNKCFLFHSCADGWQGVNCSECKPHPACHRGTCTQPWECNCYAGWGGNYCDLGKYVRSLDRINQGPQSRRRSLQLTNSTIVSITQKHFYSVAIIPFESWIDLIWLFHVWISSSYQWRGRGPRNPPSPYFSPIEKNAKIREIGAKCFESGPSLISRSGSATACETAVWKVTKILRHTLGPSWPSARIGWFFTTGYPAWSGQEYYYSTPPG